MPAAACCVQCTHHFKSACFQAATGTKAYGSSCVQPCSITWYDSSTASALGGHFGSMIRAAETGHSDYVTSTSKITLTVAKNQLFRGIHSSVVLQVMYNRMSNINSSWTFATDMQGKASAALRWVSHLAKHCKSQARKGHTPVCTQLNRLLLLLNSCFSSSPCSQAAATTAQLQAEAPFGC